MKKHVSSLPKYTMSVQGGIFSNWSWIDEDKGLARSSAPNYRELAQHSDTTQRVDKLAATYLQLKQINAVISLNEHRLHEDQLQLLRGHGVGHYLHVVVIDFQPPPKEKLLEAFEFMKNKRWLVWCGFGQGRTGTMVTAWEILSGTKTKALAIEDSTAETPAQEAVLKSLPIPHLTEFVCGLCHAVREYKKSQTKGLTLGSGRTAAFFGLRKASPGSQKIANILEVFLKRKFGVDVATYGANKTKGTALPPLPLQGEDDSATLTHLRLFVEWAADKNNDENNACYGQREFIEARATGKAGATMKGLLLTALKTLPTP